MIVQQILGQKPVDGIAYVTPGSGVDEAVKLLSTRRIGAVVVSRDGKTVDGILSERDVVRELGQSGSVVLEKRVEEMMTRQVRGCALSDTAEDVLEAMTAGRFRHMPVLEGGCMVGVISIGDVVKARLSEIHMEKSALEDMIKGY
ncbi:CBS domain-containing protein [Paroceanicella profunda]|uniref:CBS domain-containing protein n=1 Tax=Paroceanicella profunda TaxID=2579971 RepID=A0A5B8G0N4_9RHOB|nr:CBS domain-containing protein [Paroceanicella profunda]QDL92622.1 CBS domain-containing protein [Paroceanicella profunda]